MNHLKCWTNSELIQEKKNLDRYIRESRDYSWSHGIYVQRGEAVKKELYERRTHKQGMPNNAKMGA